ncbi:GNAT family N-acetyltransferase [Nocardia sp. NBC_01327]|uniref:GNAT family N-acetyltransferase n=1 Tax=Nocardia sp. NBC_01327 TaxID=2903593 RepID=UPI002E0FEC08|nr:GNAT family N-acetyltransferase [Nocardia sp. NBC_01327]
MTGMLAAAWRALRDCILGEVCCGGPAAADITRGYADASKGAAQSFSRAEVEAHDHMEGLERNLPSASYPAASSVRDIREADEIGGAEVGRTAAEPSAAPSKNVPDLSHVAPLGDLVDADRLDHQTVNLALKGLERQYGPYRLDNVSTDYEISWTAAGRRRQELLMSASIRDGEQSAGIISHCFSRDDEGKLVVENRVICLWPEFRGKGFSTEFSKAIEEYYRRSGVDRIELYADLQDGGYTWARAGFGWDLDPGKLRGSVNSIRAQISHLVTSTPGLSSADKAQLDDILARFQGHVAGYPSPNELVSLSGDEPNLGEKIMRGSKWHGMKKL